MQPPEYQEAEHLLKELDKITIALGRTFPGLCEVVLHDLRDPLHTVRTIENNISGREPGDSATELGIARIHDPGFPEVLQNYSNTFPDGRAAKSTSVGIKDSNGNYIAALCLNVDVSMLGALSHTFAALVRTDEQAPIVEESLRPKSLEDIRAFIADYAAQRGLTPLSLDQSASRELTKKLRDNGFMDIKKSIPTVSETLGVSRATIYNYLK
ncbi:DNA-binding protein [Pseudarthrobacter sulfonivorans]|uniref:DNA-binding protein n=1 Tax=Pseudarthrobacter sulfonivorans TaxID=121292 RepID=A0A0U3QM75_9MICC|nr:PAS domain-containing protein [Pseudarthrobacter sulfonivorans]ALV41396.1 DNA-binding protein [Pseudarthrobacter sulfonivorans]